MSHTYGFNFPRHTYHVESLSHPFSGAINTLEIIGTSSSKFPPPKKKTNSILIHFWSSKNPEINRFFFSGFPRDLLQPKSPLLSWISRCKLVAAKISKATSQQPTALHATKAWEYVAWVWVAVGFTGWDQTNILRVWNQKLMEMGDEVRNFHLTV